MKQKTTIAIHLSNQLMARALAELLLNSGYTVVAEGKPSTILLADSHALKHTLVATHPGTRILLVDNGLRQEELIRMLLSHKLHGILSPHAASQTLKQAVATVAEGRIWVDNTREAAGSLSNGSTINGITARQQEIVVYVCHGLSNKEIAQTLQLSEHTVKAHLSTIFRKLNITNRSKLIANATHRPAA